LPRWFGIALLVAVASIAANGWWQASGPEFAEPRSVGSANVADPADLQRLPAEARATLEAIARGGPFRYDRDGSVFQNREGSLPSKPRGYYREYTVDTPGSRDRGARRIVTGGHPPEVFYYTDDHYRSFRRIAGTSP
jgi:guanyl-specific ribonuclease Sa